MLAIAGDGEGRGVGLLAAVIVTGYRKVGAALRGGPNLGSLRLAYFIVGVIYSFTEAGFRMLSPVWIFFLLSIMAFPKSAASEDRSYVDMDEAPVLADFEPQTDNVFLGWDGRVGV